MEYLRDPDAIYAQSFAAIRAEADLSGFVTDARDIAIRIIHACGMTDITDDLRISEEFSNAARKSLSAGMPILVDAEMVRFGIVSSRLPDNVSVICSLNDPNAKEIGVRDRTTRSAAAVELWKPHLADALAVIGNAPTALFALLEMIDAGGPKPAAIVAFPVGFVGAAESKVELVREPRGVPYATLLGRRGGSAMAAAVVNAVAMSMTA